MVILSLPEHETSSTYTFGRCKTVDYSRLISSSINLFNRMFLQILSGHTAPISAIAISSAHSTLASVSWDKTLRLWDVMKGKATSEAISLTDEGSCIFLVVDDISINEFSIGCRILTGRP